MHSSLVIADRDIISFDAYLTDYNFPAGAGIKNTGIDIPGADGLYYVRNSPLQYKEVLTELAFISYNSSAEVHQNIREFLTWLRNLGQFNFYFTDDSNVYRKGYYNYSSNYSVIHGLYNYSAQFELFITQNDPYVYSNQLQTYQSRIGSGEVFYINNLGLVTPYRMYLSYSPIEGVGGVIQLQAASLGHATSASEYAETSNITINLNGNSMNYSGTVSTNDILIIDSEYYTVTKNNVSVISQFTGDILPLNPGQNEIYVTNSTGEDMFIYVEYYRRWI